MNNKFISLFYMPSKRSTEFALQFTSFLASGIDEKNDVILSIENSEFLNRLHTSENNIIYEENFAVVKDLLEENYRNYNVIDYIGYESDEIYYIVEQNWESVLYLKEFWKINEDILANIRKNQDKKVEEKIIFLNFIDGKFNEDYFIKFHFPKFVSTLDKVCIEFDENDFMIELEDELENNVDILKLSIDRQLKILSLVEKHMSYKNPKSYIRSLKLDEIKRRFRR